MEIMTYESKNNGVVVTGIGILSALGLSAAENWTNLAAGKSGIGPITHFNPENHATRIAAQLPAAFEDLVIKNIPKRITRQVSRVGQMGIVAGKSAMADSGLDIDSLDKTRVAIIIGATGTNLTSDAGTADTYYIIKNMLNSLSAWLSLEWGIKGPNYTVTTACASAAFAIGQAFDLIKLGRADVVITGGTDSYITPEGISGFNALMALSENNSEYRKACRPFDKNRDGFVMGEGAGILILESEAHARNRNARIYAELAGYAVSSEAYNIMSPEKDGRGMALCMQQALINSCIKPEEIDYINAHGTGTHLNDLYETKAIKSVFDERSYRLPVSSSKSMFGHTLGASCALESIVCIQSIKHNLVPPTINYETPDPECDLDYVPNHAREQQVDTVLCNSFAFGGHNASLIYKRYVSSINDTVVSEL